MRRYAPILTLVVVAALGAVLLVVNTVASTTAGTAASTVAVGPPGADGIPGEPAPPPAADPPAEPAPPVEHVPAPPPPAIAEKVWTGRSSGNEVAVAVAVRDGRAVGYVCDGEQVEAWLEGTLAGDQLSLTGTRDPAVTLTGTVTEAAALGTVTVAGRQWPYAAQGVQAPAGLYEGRAVVRGVANRIGWVVENDGRVTGGRRAAEAASPQPAPAFDPAAPDTVTLDGVPVMIIPVAVGAVGGAPVGADR